MTDIAQEEKMVRGFFSDGFIAWFRGLFRPITRMLYHLGVTPNAITIFSAVLATFVGVLIALDFIYSAILIGLVAGFSDIIDGQLAKEFNLSSRFGAILDSTVDRYNEFFVFAGFGARYLLMERPWFVLLTASAFAGSLMISYVKARAEADGVPCKVGLLQRPERLALLGIGMLFHSPGIDTAIVILAVATHLTALQRLIHVQRQLRRSGTV